MNSSEKEWGNFNTTTDKHAKKQLSVEEIKQSLLTRLEEVLSHILSNGRINGEVFEVGDIQNTQGKSLKVELNPAKAGLWFDFATGEGGDIFHLWAMCKGLDITNQFPDVIHSIREWLGISVSRTSRHTKKEPLAWIYKDLKGNSLVIITREETEKGKRFLIQDARTLEYKAPTPRPLYNQQGIKASKQVVLVEGEKCAEALIEQGICATTAIGGANAPITKTDWSPLVGKNLIIWPDNDKCGHSFAKNVSKYLKGQKGTSIAILSVPRDKPEKWDAADAVKENIEIKSFIETASAATDFIYYRRYSLFEKPPVEYLKIISHHAF